ncbi:uncharacterized protein LOC129325148 [Eublepharis macularius]|uniref:Uncharacterized protein LOC129325148 n=1 Tax=Eublepharis macularius TaxID=481883 RepID=A0AA97IZP8_EUBMA|nr:uncharacterized protein LOC129325148 [Eublepharis macularius]
MSHGGDSYVKRGISWRHREIMDLLHFWGEEKIQEALRNTHRNLDYFERISEQMATRGHRRSALECRSKTKTMRLEYEKVVAHNNRSGNAPITCPYYRELESILRGDASVNPKRIARSMVLQVVGQVQPETLVLQRGSEELFSHDLHTCNPAEIRMSTPYHTEDCDGLIEAEGHALEPDLDATPDGLLDDGFIDRGFTMQEDFLDKENNPPSPRSTAEGSMEMTTPDLSPGTRLDNIRCRKRPVSAITSAAEKLLSLASAEHQEELALRRQEQEETKKWREEEGRRHQEFLQETRLERRMFQDAWSQNLEVMRATVQTLKSFGEAFLMQQTPKLPELTNGHVEDIATDNTRKGAPKRSCVGKARERLTL